MGWVKCLEVRRVNWVVCVCKCWMESVAVLNSVWGREGYRDEQESQPSGRQWSLVIIGY